MKIKAQIFFASSMIMMSSTHADFFKDSQTSLQLKNYLFETDYGNENTNIKSQQSKRSEWAQGVTWNVESGYTNGSIGFGLDMVTMLGLKLASDPEESGTQLLALSDKVLADYPSYAKEAKDSYTKIGLTAKIKYEDTVLKYGYLSDNDNPTLMPNTARLFPQSFRGWNIDSKFTDNLSLKAGYIDRVKQRHSEHYENLAIDQGYARFNQTEDSNYFVFSGVTYQFNSNLTGKYFYAHLDNSYQQHYVSINSKHQFGDDELSITNSYFSSSEVGGAFAGDIDNKMYTTYVDYQFKQSIFSVGYQKVVGNSALPYLNGAGAFTPTTSMVSLFTLQNESTWWIQHKFNFKNFGWDGLTISNKYLNGSQIRLLNRSDRDKEWERNSDINLVVQSGFFKNLMFTARHASHRSSVDRGSDQTRLILSYTIAF